MATDDAARPPSEQADNGEEVLQAKGESPAAEARRQADQITQQRHQVGTGSAPARHEGQRQNDTSAD